MRSNHLSLLGLLALSGIQPGPDPLAGIDIVREYELIQQKQSRLSRAKRDLVVYRMQRYLEEKANV